MKLKFNKNYTSRFKTPTKTVFRPTKNHEKYSTETNEKSVKYALIKQWLKDSEKCDKECREVTTNVNNSSKTGQTGSDSMGSSETSSFSTTTKQTSREESSTTNEKSQTTKIAAMFVTASRNVQHVSSDVVRADCMNHGYKIDKTVGEGAYAKVKLADVLPSKMARNADLADNADNDGNLKVAIKVIDGRNVPREFLKKFLPRELANHVPLPPHKHVVRVFEQFKSGDRYYVVMEFCSRGDLLDLINQRISESKKGLGEDRARNLFRMLAEGIHHIHAHGIVHRDLKCENVLLDKDDNIKITDFGFSTKFKPGISSLLKTSCGSYAYTAPEVIKVRPYDGTKSDIWSMGIILFAMLNGRLPFNDAQLSELEEDMKMQRLRFERTVSFESMVLVRRMLQYNPSSRPALADILTDPWLTGRRAIPRQPLKPKWTNPYQHKSAGKTAGMMCQPEVTSSDGVAVYYKGTVTERGPEATVTLSHNKHETVVLKSRTGSTKKNIWISGPPASQRPNTWPRSDKTVWKSSTKRGSPTRRSSASYQNNMTIGAKQRTNKPCTGKNMKNARLSQELVQKHMAEKEVTSNSTETCVCCKAEADIICPKTRQGTGKDEDVDMLILDKGDVIKTAVTSVSACDKKYTLKAVSAKARTSGRMISSEVCKSLSASPRRKSTSSDARSALASAVSPVKLPMQQPISPDQGQGQVQSWVNYMVNPTTSPAERVKYFRDRLMKLYGSDERPEAPNNGASGLPPLLVQSMTTTVRSVDASNPASPQPPPQPTTSRKMSQSPTRCSAGTRRPSAPASTWRSARSLRTSGKSKLPVKPKQRVVVHSAVV